MRHQHAKSVHVLSMPDTSIVVSTVLTGPITRRWNLRLVKRDIKESPTQVIESLTSSIDRKLNKLSVDPSNLYAACINKVSQKLRKVNEAAYTP